MTTARRDTMLWILCVTPAVLLRLHAWAILPLLWSSQPLTTFQTSTGFAYTAPLGSTWMSREMTGDSPAQLTEDGRQLGPANSPGVDIAGEGHGRFALIGRALYFSASDNSDPISNGRRYVLHWPAPPGRALTWTIRMLALVSTLALLVRYRVPIAAALLGPPFWLVATVFLAIAVVPRLWYFTDFPVPSIVGDSASYYVLVEAMDAGRWPEFGIRPPGYPVLMKLVFAVSDRIMSLVIVQNLLTLGACLALIYAMHLYRRSLALWSALAMGVFVSGLWVLDSDTSMLSDGPYSNAIIFAMAFLIVGLVRRTAGPFLAASTMMGAAILFRPAGMFLFVIYGLCLAFLVRNRFGRRQAIAFAVPLPALMLSLCLYNFFTIRAFAMSEFGEINFAMATFTFWEQDPRYAPEVNEGIARAQAVIRATMTDEDLARVVGFQEIERGLSQELFLGRRLARPQAWRAGATIAGRAPGSGRCVSIRSGNIPTATQNSS